MCFNFTNISVKCYVKVLPRWFWLKKEEDELVLQCFSIQKSTQGPCESFQPPGPQFKLLWAFNTLDNACIEKKKQAKTSKWQFCNFLRYVNSYIKNTHLLFLSKVHASDNVFYDIFICNFLYKTYKLML